MSHAAEHLLTRFAATDLDRRAAERLRYKVFVEELGGDGPLVDHKDRLERDRFDPYYDHLLLIDRRRDESGLDHVVGVYRLLTEDGAERAGQFYSEDEYDLAALRGSGRKLLELGRSCLHPDYRGGAGMFLLWNALAAHILANGFEILFGVASFHGNDVAAVASSLSLLHHNHLAPAELRVRAREPAYQPMDLMPLEKIDRASAMQAIPALIKAYLRLGGVVGDGAYIDRDFNTIDVCLIVDIERISKRMRAIYARGVE